jgi:hypothetical protein
MGLSQSKNTYFELFFKKISKCSSKNEADFLFNDKNIKQSVPATYRFRLNWIILFAFHTVNLHGSGLSIIDVSKFIERLHNVFLGWMQDEQDTSIRMFDKIKSTEQSTSSTDTYKNRVDENLNEFFTSIPILSKIREALCKQGEQKIITVQIGNPRKFPKKQPPPPLKPIGPPPENIRVSDSDSSDSDSSDSDSSDEFKPNSSSASSYFPDSGETSTRPSSASSSVSISPPPTQSPMIRRVSNASLSSSASRVPSPPAAGFPKVRSNQIAPSSSLPPTSPDRSFIVNQQQQVVPKKNLPESERLLKQLERTGNKPQGTVARPPTGIVEERSQQYLRKTKNRTHGGSSQQHTRKIPHIQSKIKNTRRRFTKEKLRKTIKRNRDSSSNKTEIKKARPASAPASVGSKSSNYNTLQ